MMSGKSGKPVFLTAGSIRLAREETAVSAERSFMLLLLVAAARKRGFDAKPGRAVKQGTALIDESYCKSSTVLGSRQDCGF